jgi:hypothetical protein
MNINQVKYSILHRLLSPTFVFFSLFHEQIRQEQMKSLTYYVISGYSLLFPGSSPVRIRGGGYLLIPNSKDPVSSFFLFFVNIVDLYFSLN